MKDDLMQIYFEREYLMQIFFHRRRKKETYFQRDICSKFTSYISL